MTEKEKKLINRLRSEIGDKEEPYRFLDEDLYDLLKEAVGDYSRHRPQKLRGKLTLLSGVTEYQLPDDYQTWISGLAGYDIFERTLFLSATPTGQVDLVFTYLGDHTLETIPDRDASLLCDYSMWKLLDSIVREGAEISGLKLGKGLDIKFGNFDQISAIAKQRHERYMQLVTKPLGVWS